MGASRTPAQAIVDVLLSAQQKGLERDDSHGILSARQVGERVGLKPKEARELLVSLAAAGRVRRFDAANGLFWRTTNPLPWEPGGKWPGQAERELRELQVRLASLVSETETVRAAVAKAFGQ